MKMVSRFVALLMVTMLPYWCMVSCSVEPPSQPPAPAAPPVVCQPDPTCTQCQSDIAQARSNLAARTEETEQCKGILANVRAELEDLKQTDVALFAQAKDLFDQEQYTAARLRIKALTDRYPESRLTVEASKMLKKMDDIELVGCMEPYRNTVTTGETDSAFDSAISVVEQCLQACPKCPSAASGRSLLKQLAKAQKQIPVLVSSIKEYKLRYADLLERPARITGYVKASQYYNCRFDNPRVWRAFKITDRENSFESITVYCNRGEQCEQLYSRLVGGASLKGTFVVVYPRHNSVCEADQAHLTGFTSL